MSRTKVEKGADKGIDGRIYFHDEARAKTKQVILSVKSGHTTAAHVRDLRGVVEREKAAIGVLISMKGRGQVLQSILLKNPPGPVVVPSGSLY